MKRWCRGLTYSVFCFLLVATSGYAQVQLGPTVIDDGTLGEPDYQPEQLQLGTPVTDDALGELAYQSTAQPTSQVAAQTPEQLQQLVAPIALYPDALVAQVLAASTYPTEVVEAQRWMQQHPDLKGQALAQAVDQQPWDPSVRALTQFPSVLASMDRNLSWTSALGDAYVNQPPDVLDAVQIMRRRAQQAGNLQSTAQQTVTAQGQTVIIQPASPEVVYVPAYDPWLVYGPPIVAYPGWVAVPGVFVAAPGIYFGAGFGVGFFAGFGWGWPAWGCDWFGRRVIFHHAPFVSHSMTFNHHRFEHGGFDHGGFDHGGFDHGGFDRGERDHGSFGHGGFDHGGADHGSFGHGGFDRGGSAQDGQGHSGAFSGFDHGGTAGGNSSRGHASFGGGSHGGGSHGGGGGGGGGGHR